MSVVQFLGAAFLFLVVHVYIILLLIASSTGCLSRGQELWDHESSLILFGMVCLLRINIFRDDVHVCRNEVYWGATWSQVTHWVQQHSFWRKWIKVLGFSPFMTFIAITHCALLFYWVQAGNQWEPISAIALGYWLRNKRLNHGTAVGIDIGRLWYKILVHSSKIASTMFKISTRLFTSLLCHQSTSLQESKHTVGLLRDCATFPSYGNSRHHQPIAGCATSHDNAMLGGGEQNFNTLLSNNLMCCSTGKLDKLHDVHGCAKLSCCLKMRST